MIDEMDILKEVGTTAAAHGSIALSEILGRKIMLELPSIDMIPCQRVPKEVNIEGMVLTMHTQILGSITGKIIFVLEEKSAFKLVDICYKNRDPEKKISLFTEMGISVIKEIGNIIICSYISYLSFFVKKLIIPTFPILVNAPFSEIINMISIGYEQNNYILLTKAIFKGEKEEIKGNFWLVLTPDTAEEIKKVCKDILKSI